MKSHEMLPTILHPTDLTEYSREALKTACLLARARAGKLVVLHVVPRLAPVPVAASVHELYKAEHVEADQEQYRTEMMEQLEQLTIPDPDIPIQRKMAEGAVAREILKFAEENPCELIVMGTHTHEEPELPLLGSAAREVMQKARCPVVIVKMPT